MNKIRNHIPKLQFLNIKHTGLGSVLISIPIFELCNIFKEKGASQPFPGSESNKCPLFVTRWTASRSSSQELAMYVPEASHSGA